MNFDLEVARFELGWLPGEQLPEVAVRMLEADYDSQELREVAGMLNPTLRDAGNQFATGLRAAGIPSMTREEAVEIVKRRTLERIASGETDPYLGAREIHRIWLAVGYPADLAIFVGLEDEYEDHPADRSAIEAEIVEAARLVLEGQKPPRAI